MKRRPSIRRIGVGIAAAAAMIAASGASAQTQEVQSRVVTHQAATAQPEAGSLVDWENRYAEALEAARQLQTSDRTRALGEKLELDLAAYDEALKTYVRASERLRHKDRAVTAAIDELKSSEGASSRTFQTMSNAMKAGHEAVKSMINNIR